MIFVVYIKGKTMSVNIKCQSGNMMEKNIQAVSLFCKSEKIVSSTAPTLQLNNALLQSEHLFKRLRMIWCQLEDIILEDKLPPNFNSICENNEILEHLQNCVFAFRESVSDRTKNVLETQISLFRRSIFRFSEMEDFKLNRLNCNALRRESSGICQYFHTYLNIQWHLIVIDYCLFGYSNNTRNNVILFMKDLTILSYIRYNKLNIREVESDPFLCPCVKTTWVCIQLLLEKQSNLEFWSVFNEVLNERDSAFSLWLLYHVATLQGFDETGNFIGATCHRVAPNLDFVEAKLKHLFTEGSVTPIFVHCCLLNIEPLIDVWWNVHVKVGIFQLLWEYFYKTLNNITEDNNPTNALQILTLVENLRTDPRSAKTAFQLYVGMLAKYLNKHGNQWFKLKGRIYSRLPVKKSSSLGKSAFYNVYLLFICLAPVDFEELTGRVESMLENLPEDQQNSIFVWNLYCALIILYLQNERPVHTMGEKFVSLIQENVKSRDYFHLIKKFVNNLDCIIKSSSNYTLGQFVFLDSWIKKYLQHSHIADADELLKLLINIVNQVYIFDAWTEWDSAFQIHIFPTLKQLAALPNASPLIGELAAVLCKVNSDLCNQSMAYFTEDPVDPAVSRTFALTVLQNQLLTRQESFIIRAWLRCCILSTDNNVELTKHVLGLHVSFRTLKINFGSNSNALCDLLEALAKETNPNAKENALKLIVDNLVNVDVWIKSYVRDPRNEALTIHIYTCIAVLVHHFASFLYNKTKSCCLFSRIITTLLLPAETLMGRTLHNFVLHSVQRTWHLFFKGICSLNWSDDPFLDRKLRELIVCYVPHFPTDNSSPLLKCFDNETIASMIIQKTATAFLSQCASSNKQHSLKVLYFFDNFINNCKSLVIMRFIAQNTVIVLLEFLMSNLHCNAAVSVLISFVSNDYYYVVREDVHRSILTITDKHLKFNSTNYFQLVHILIKIIKSDIRVLLPNIRQAVILLERTRGDGIDSTLRNGLLGIETALSA